MGARIEGLNDVIANIRNIIPTETRRMNEKLVTAGILVETAVKEQASLTDHTLEDLALMGHPYSRRYPTDSGPHPDKMVHKQSGLLYANIEKNENINVVHSSVEVGVNEQNVPYIEDLINGTSKMRPRNFIGTAFHENIDEIIALLQGK